MEKACILKDHDLYINTSSEGNSCTCAQNNWNYKLSHYIEQRAVVAKMLVGDCFKKGLVFCTLLMLIYKANQLLLEKSYCNRFEVKVVVRFVDYYQMINFTSKCFPRGRSLEFSLHSLSNIY